MGKERCAAKSSCKHSVLQCKTMAAAVVVLCNFLCSNIFHSYVCKKIICAGCYSLGRCICKRYRLHRHVADGKEKSRKLVLVDRNQYCLYSFILCKRICVYECVLSCSFNNGIFWIGGMEEEGAEKSTGHGQWSTGNCSRP